MTAGDGQEMALRVVRGGADVGAMRVLRSDAEALRVVRGDPTCHELAALTAVLLSLAAAESAAAESLPPCRRFARYLRRRPWRGGGYRGPRVW